MVSCASNAIITITFLAIGICGLFLIGNTVTSDLNTSLGQIDGTFICQCCRLIFTSILLAMLSHNFFTCKEGALAAYDEYQT